MLRDLDLKSGQGHTGAHMWSSEVYPHTKLGRSWKNFFRRYGRTDTPEFQSTRSSLGDDLKSNV